MTGILTENKGDFTVTGDLNKEDSPQDIHNKTSRGYILETIETIADLESAIDHLFDLNEDQIMDNLGRIETLSVLRQELINTLSIDFDIDYHCAFKHLVRSYGRMKEKIVSELRKGNSKNVTKLFNVYILIRQELYNVAKLYLNKDEDFDLGCPKCQDDKR